MSVFLGEGKEAVLASFPQLASVLPINSPLEFVSLGSKPCHIEWEKQGMGSVGGGGGGQASSLARQQPQVPCL